MPIARLVVLAEVLQMPIESLVEGLRPSPARSNDQGESWTSARPAGAGTLTERSGA